MKIFFRKSHFFALPAHCRTRQENEKVSFHKVLTSPFCFSFRSAWLLPYAHLVYSTLEHPTLYWSIPRLRPRVVKFFLKKIFFFKFREVCDGSHECHAEPKGVRTVRRWLEVSRSVTPVRTEFPRKTLCLKRKINVPGKNRSRQCTICVSLLTKH